MDAVPNVDLNGDVDVLTFLSASLRAIPVALVDFEHLMGYLDDGRGTQARNAAAAALSYIRHRKSKMWYATHYAANLPATRARAP